jgi:ATP-dependent helicase/nuclease subunit A
MSEVLKPLHTLTNEQFLAVQPNDDIWLSASAGTGKTQVLTARVIRLLLEENVQPENILCITFTKAGASEMAQRINERLASWVQASNNAIFHDLAAIGIEGDSQRRQNASRLFAKVLDAPGGGMQMTTIHSLCQSLLSSFPEEAGLVPGFKLVEGREQDELYRDALSELIVTSEGVDDDWVLKILQSMALAMDEGAAFRFLQRCAAETEAFAGISDGPGATMSARRLVGVEFDGSMSEFLEGACSDSVIDRASIMQFAEMNAQWVTKSPKGKERPGIIRQWLAASAAERAENWYELTGCWSNKDGTQSKTGPKTEDYAHISLNLYLWSQNLNEQLVRFAYADRLADALRVGKAYAAQYALSKSQRGLVDYNDMIRKTASMLKSGAMADWVKFKLDRQIDHILIDEAQDTNAAQWEIVRALAGDFFSGLSAKGEFNRTIFSVGDYKQAIFGFQGTDPEKYEEAGKIFADLIKNTGGELLKLDLAESFRSTQPVLKFINAVIEQGGPTMFGPDVAVPLHTGGKPDCGMIELFAPVLPPVAETGIGEEGQDNDEENWLTKEKAILAHRIAGYVRKLIDEKPVLTCTGKPLVPGDIMILLRSRSDLAANLVGRLHAVNVPVSGVDRLKLTDPVAVQDLMAAVRFVLQPGDDLSLASLLVSPLFGWSQEQLLEFGYRPSNTRLWQHIRGQAALAQDVQSLRTLLASADYSTSYRFLEAILSGRLQGRKKMVARLGSESLVPIEELLNAALQFDQNIGGTLQAFLAWFESGDSEIVRNGISGENEVRIMTVHGSKGLQAPVVILADITGDPKMKGGGSAEYQFKDGSRLPLLPIRKAEQTGQLEAIVMLQSQREQAEHRRLLYVAISRAEERLVMAGALGKKSKGIPAEESWYTSILAGLEAMGCEWQEEAPWGQVMRYLGADGPVLAENTVSKNVAAVVTTLPEWIWADAPEESRPPRPLVPSHIGGDDYGDAPATAAMRTAAEKGRLIHGLFERISGEGMEQFDRLARIWLNRNNSNPAISNEDIIASVAQVVANSDWSVFFGGNASAEVPLAAVVGETVITGRVDRLVIEPGMIRVLDFKTGRNIPSGGGFVPAAYLRQMAHYVAALEMIFPGSKVEASLLFTHGPKMIRLHDDDLAPHKPGC